MKNIFIENSEIGHGQKCFLIAEIAQAHDGSLGIAHSYIDAVAEAGVDAIKFQTHIAKHLEDTVLTLAMRTLTDMNIGKEWNSLNSNGLELKSIVIV